MFARKERECCVCEATLVNDYNVYYEHVLNHHPNTLFLKEYKARYVRDVILRWSDVQEAQPTEWLSDEPVRLLELQHMFGFEDPCGLYFNNEKDDHSLTDETFPVLKALAKLRDSGFYEVIDHNPDVHHFRMPIFNQSKRVIPETFQDKTPKKHHAMAGKDPKMMEDMREALIPPKRNTLVKWANSVEEAERERLRKRGTIEEWLEKKAQEAAYEKEARLAVEANEKETRLAVAALRREEWLSTRERKEKESELHAKARTIALAATSIGP